MTAPELDELLNGYELQKPITLDDVDEITTQLRGRVAAGVPWEVYFTNGDALHVSVGARGPAQYVRTLRAC